MTDKNSCDPGALDLFVDDLELEQLEDGLNPGFTTAASAACAGSASCPVGCASSMSSVSSAGG